MTPLFNRQTLAAHIESCGGLATVPDLAVRWGVSRTRGYQLAKDETFPAPVAEVAEGRIAIYVVEEADAWREARLSRVSRREAAKP